MKVLFSPYLTPLLIVLGFGACKKAPDRTFSNTSEATQNAADDAKEGAEKPAPMKDTRDIVGKIMLANHDCSADPMAGQPELRLLSPNEYQNTIVDVLKVKKDYRGALISPTPVAGFGNNADVGTLSETHVLAYLDTAIKIADETRPNLPALVGCSENDKVTCANKVISTIAPALWRRPLTADETKELLALSSQSTVAAESMNLLLTRLMTSANFLYRSEIGKAGNLNPYELASGLSYFFWGSVPDKELIDLAANGTLAQEAVLLGQANRLFADKRSSYFLNDFSASWLGYSNLDTISKDAKLYPSWTPDIPGLMIAEANSTFEYLVRHQDTKFQNLFSNDFTIGSAKLAQFYNAPSYKDGPTEWISFKDEKRRGIFSLGAILSALAVPNKTNPFKRGDFILAHLLCEVPIPTPEGLVVTLPESKPDMTTRELVALHTANPGCKGCHIKLDAAGFGTEDFDAIGIFRDTENGKPIDDSGQLLGIDGADSSFNGTAELNLLLSKSRQAKRCFTLQLYRYAHGHLEREQDICSVRDIAAQFETNDLSLSQLIIKVITHGSFMKRGQ